MATPAIKARVAKLREREARARMQAPSNRCVVMYTRDSVVPRGDGGDGTIPTPLADLSDFNFATHVQPNGRKVRIEVLGGLVVPERLAPGGAEMPPLVLQPGPISFLAFGDSGKGDVAQFETASALTAIARERSVQFGVHVGDIYYPHGIATAKDPAVKQLYVDAYRDLPHVHAIMGNHDYGDSQGAGVPEAVIAAAKTEVPGIYEFPQRYYSRRIIAGDVTVRMIFIDTSTLPVDPTQLAWLRDELAKDSEYTIVAGHHPIYDNGWRGASSITRKLILPLLDARADMYLCGHEHNQQVLHSKGGLPIIVSGAAAEARETWRAKDADFTAIRRGAAFLKIDADGIALDMVAAHSKSTLFSRTYAKRERRPLPEALPARVMTPRMPLAYYKLQRGHSTPELSVDADKLAG